MKLFNTIIAAGLCCALNSACDPGDERNSSSLATEVSPDHPVTSMQDIEGLWLIERFEDFRPSWQNRTPWRSAYVQIGRNDLVYNVGCNQSGTAAAIGEDGVLRQIGEGPRPQTLQGCLEDREARDRRFFAFFGKEPEVVRLNPERILMRRGPQELVLVRPDRWRRDHKPSLSEIEGRWVPRAGTTYDGWGFKGFALGENQGIISIWRDRLTWSLCPEVPVPVRWTEDGRLVAKGPVDWTRCRAAARSTSDGLQAITALLAASPAVLRTGPDRIVLIDGTAEQSRQIELQTEESFLNPPPPPNVPGQQIPPAPPPPPPRKSTTDDHQTIVSVRATP